LLRSSETQLRNTTAIVSCHGELRHAPQPVFDLLLRYAVSEDGALHAEKYHRTVTEEARFRNGAEC
jgi:hypothetical protein